MSVGNDGGGGDRVVVLGLSFDFHDSAAAVVVDGQIVAAAEEERFSRRKHDRGLPEQAVAACLDVAGLAASEVDHVVFYEKPLTVASRYLAAKQREGPRAFRSFMRDAPTVFGTNLMAGYRVASMMRRLGAERPPQLQFVEHHLSHAASAYFPSPFDHAAVLTVDGLGEWATATIGHGTQHRLTLLEELRYPDSMGLVYSLVTAYCGFTPNDDEYKVMGLAPYGTPRFADALRELVTPQGDGSIKVDGRRLRWYGPRAMKSSELARRFGGPPRDPDAELTDREADLAASVQVVTEEVMLAMAARAMELTGETRLCLAGGVALNCVANGRVLRESGVDEIWVQPAAGDAGGAIGAALAYWHLEMGRPRDLAARSGPDADAMSGAFLGPAPTDDEIRTALDAEGIASRRVADPDELADLVAARLADGDIVALYQGRMEFGPRALGHRSLLADPRSPTVRQRLNLLTKGREGFRPFAPAVLADHASEWFELDQPSPYMLVVAPVLPDRLSPVDDEPTTIAERAVVARSEIPACTHVDGSARIQTVDAASNPDFHRIISAFHRRTGCPMVVNTSFNRAGEPIVASVAGAIASGRAASVDLLVLGDVVVDGADLAAGTDVAAATAEEPRADEFAAG